MSTPVSVEDFQSSSAEPVAVAKWLTTKYIQNILQKFLREPSAKVQSLKLEPCGKSGDAYASTMYRIEVKVQCAAENPRTGSYIVKMLPTSELAREKLGTNSYNVQQKEMNIFQKVFPEFRKILKSINEDRNIFPNAIAVDLVRDVLILEDLAVKEYVMADRKFGLDLNHLHLAIKKLAKFHAASIICLDENPDLLKNYNVGMFSRETKAFHDFFGSNFDALAAEVSSWNGFQYYAKKLNKLKGRMYENAFKAFDNDEGDLKVLIHGDLWINNLMIKYNKKKIPTDVIIVRKLMFDISNVLNQFCAFQLDFQFCCIGHPAIDLMYFLHTSSVDEIRQDKVLQLTQYYYYELKNILLRLNYNLAKFPTLHEFQIQCMKKYFYGECYSLLRF